MIEGFRIHGAMTRRIISKSLIITYKVMSPRLPKLMTHSAMAKESTRSHQLQGLSSR